MKEYSAPKRLSSTFDVDIHDEDHECNHLSFEIVEPCCTSIGESGYIECGCGGMKEIICHSDTCTGIDDEFFIEKIYGGGSECDV